MAQKNDKWNISKQKGEEIAHKYIIDILQTNESNTMIISDLIILLNLQTKHIKLIHKSKKKPLSTYIRCIYGSFEHFLNSFSIYSVIMNDEQPHAKLRKQELTYDIVKEYNDWILVDEDDFIVV